MKIYVNARFLSQPISGVQRYGIECCLKIKKKHKECVFLAPPFIHNKQAADELGVTVIGKGKGHLWEQRDLPRFLRKQNNPPLFNPCNTAPLFYNYNYITLHDLAFYHHPEWNSKKFATWYNILIPRLVQKSKHIFTVSNTIRAEIETIYRLPASKISITYNGIAEAMLHSDRSIAPKEKIILSVGSFNTRKNHHSLITAFCNSDIKNEYSLVITGDKSKVFSETGIDEQTLKQNNIIVLSNLSEAALADMYRRAAIVASLSFYEGFGIPLLEGLYYGCKILCSDIPVYRELYGGVATFCSLHQPEAITDALAECVKTAAPLPEVVDEMCSRYSYDAAANEILRVTTRG
jgi:glycosyltransferase involved in cell wall biosynthesis